MKKLETSQDYRRKADELWAEAREEEKLGNHDLANILKDVSSNLHNIARKKEEAEHLLKNTN